MYCKSSLRVSINSRLEKSDIVVRRALFALRVSATAHTGPIGDRESSRGYYYTRRAVFTTFADHYIIALYGRSARRRFARRRRRPQTPDLNRQCADFTSPSDAYVFWKKTRK